MAWAAVTVTFTGCDGITLMCVSSWSGEVVGNFSPAEFTFKTGHLKYCGFTEAAQ